MPFSAKPRQAKEAIKLMIEPREGHKSVNPLDTFNMMKPHTLNKISNIKYKILFMLIHLFYLVMFNRKIPTSKSPIPKKPCLFTFSLNRITPVATVSIVPPQPHPAYVKPSGNSNRTNDNK